MLLDPSAYQQIENLLAEGRKRKIEVEMAADLAKLDQIGLDLKTLPEKIKKHDSDLSVLKAEHEKLAKLQQDLRELEKFLPTDESRLAAAKVRDALAKAAKHTQAISKAKAEDETRLDDLKREEYELRKRLEVVTAPPAKPEKQVPPELAWDPKQDEKDKYLREFDLLRADIEHFRARRIAEYMVGSFRDEVGIRAELACASAQWWVMKCTADMLYNADPPEGILQQSSKLFYMLSEYRRTLAPSGYVKGLSPKSEMDLAGWTQYARDACRRARDYKARTDRPKPSKEPPSPPTLEKQAADLVEATENQVLAIYGGMPNRQAELVGWLSQHLKFKKITWYESTRDRDDSARLEYSLRAGSVKFLLIFTQWAGHPGQDKLLKAAKQHDTLVLKCTSSSKQEVLSTLAKMLIVNA